MILVAHPDRKKIHAKLNCQNKFPANSKFCPNCGAQANQEKFCPECGNKVAAGAKFCPSCGKGLA